MAELFQRYAYFGVVCSCCIYIEKHHLVLSWVDIDVIDCCRIRWLDFGGDPRYIHIEDQDQIRVLDCGCSTCSSKEDGSMICRE